MKKQILDVHKKHPSMSLRGIARLVGCHHTTVMKHLSKPQTQEVPEKDDVCVFREKREAKSVILKNKELVQRVVELEEQIDLLKHLDSHCTSKGFVIKPSKAGEASATAFAIASDWHSEERVKSATVNGMNEFTLDIAEGRIEKFFQSTLRLLKNKQKNITIDTLVLALMGDFISGSIHDDTMESAQLSPSQALTWVFGKVSAGIRFLLANSEVNIVIPCHSGNHGRFTQKQRVANEAGNSYEYLSYHFLAREFATEKRVEFQVSEGYHSFMDVQGFIIRFHHGHYVRYQGGIGGIYIPAHKAIGEWNKARRADLDVFGHFHSQIFSPIFVCNGSLIGYSPFAISIKAPYQKPMQAFFLVHHQRQQVIDQCPIWLD